MWKQEDGAGEAAVGPAWVDTFGEDGSTTHTQQAAGGEWISRQHARELAEAHGWEYFEDAPNDQAADDDPVGSVDVRAVNRRLRKLGIAKDDLSVGSVDGDTLYLQGLWLDRLPGVEPPRTVDGVTYRTGAIGATPNELAEALDLLAPGWRDE